MGTIKTSLSPAKIFGRPTADEIWLGPAQRRALAFLHKPASTKLLLGPRGSGKSVLLERSLKELENTVYFRSRDGWESPGELLGALLASADIVSMDSSEVAQRNLFVTYLQHQWSLGRKIQFAIDDAERLSPAIWRELNRLRAVRCEGRYAPEFVLVGRDDALAFLQSKKANGWESVRLAVHHLPAPNGEDVLEYIEDRLGWAKLPKTLFTREACALISELAGGSFTSVNILCQMSLVLANKRSATTVDAELVKSARAAIGEPESLVRRPMAQAQGEATRSGELILSRADKLIGRYSLAPHMLLGSSEQNHIQLESADVSRHHAAIVKTPGGHQIVSLDSARGLTVNGMPVTRKVLSDRDVVALGPFRLEFISPRLTAAARGPKRARGPAKKPGGTPARPYLVSSKG